MQRTKLAILLSLLVACAGCQTVMDIMDIFDDPVAPTPIAGPANAGAVVNGKTCVQMTDGTWQWVPASRRR